MSDKVECVRCDDQTPYMETYAYIKNVANGEKLIPVNVRPLCQKCYNHLTFRYGRAGC